MSYIAVIGAGSWGTTLASLLSKKGFDVIVWAREKEIVDSINNKRENIVYLPGISLPESLICTDDLFEAIKKARFIINVVPTQFIRNVFSQLKNKINDENIIVSASKGIEKNTLKTPSQILEEILNKKIYVLSGPSFAIEVAKEKPTAVTISGANIKERLLLQEIFSTHYFRVYEHDDPIGAEIGGAVKNVIAIASGICDALELGNNARAALITRGLHEIMRLGKKMGAKERTFSGLSGLGDLFLTCTSTLSRNYTVGYRLGKGETFEEITKSMRSVAEGVETSQSAMELSKKLEIEMPITEQVYQVIYEGKDPKKATDDLMNRTLKPEFY
ncbi:MAG: NAD(P)H-dependent glycerol-3-phosphate dehydrogenase [Thermodesulfovibrio sp.]|uniref:NAD(P)H-dependent glycerol-3-phosphate dehydrogenase n=1 Tax=unclassified Thermodesulfovibrio TaxID=2645936 RepID=UPI00083A1702|nr:MULTISPECIES: NAD(P)H-dependent glycerol-3-phosphate dehydrogenase [unclassified Thermodesulfovibrio]MDI1471118.1 NAD(P)H-dependent glycerol-3-phosphate dehydrogenase [Thermodesulfovibrio sp. 1176]MDI6713968.1 NAD(P)H-dependent glycerol-3-phosphate dehydrogenase [Thermodesulfovibrio sp.]ODA44978.1 Glycerol-3-phosphate dehydrogenase [NAD(P)+] [Thermodesulfovibrio sp. N1]